MTIDLVAINAERQRIEADYLQTATSGRRAVRGDCTTSR
jgi:hypothetical protein